MYRSSAIRWVGNAFMIFCLVGVVLSPNPAGAGNIKAPLDKIMAESGIGEKIAVIAVFKDKVDNEALNQRLKTSKATLVQRHYEVITTLKQKAILTQNPVMTVLQNLEAQGEVDEINNFWISNMIAFRGTAKAIAAMAALEPVELVEFDRPVESIKPIMSDSEPPLISSHSQGLNVINAPAVWAMGYTGAGRLVSNIDTGVDGTHPALSSRWRGNNGHPASECWFDPVENSTTPIDHGEGDTPHGTHTMGTICGRSATTYDTVGVAIDAQWIAAASVDYGGSTSDLIASFQFIADPDDNPYTMDDVPDVVGNSWGWSPFWPGYEHCDDTFWSVMDGCENAGVVVIFSAGNEGEEGANSLRTPADRATTYLNAFAVGAIDGHTAGYPIAYFSSLGPCICASGNMNIKPECVAPGVDIYSSVPGGYEGGWNGTSMASPHISGAVAILRQVNPNLDVDSIKTIIIQSCVNLGPAGEDNTYGHGYLNLYLAVQLAMTNMGFVEGYVRDAVYNSGLPATVSVVGSSTSTTAGSSGYYILTLPADTTYNIRASYGGYISETHNVTIVLDDTATQNFYLDPPIVGYQPVSYNVQVAPGESTDRDLLIMNTGLGTLNYSLDAETYSGLLLDNGQEIPISISAALPEPLGYSSSNSDKPEAIDEPYYPPIILDEGGPDSFGHSWIDSDEPGGPTVSWVDISSSGTTVTPGEDSYVGPISIGFSFPFYTNNYSSLYICSNGMLTFGSGSTDYTNDNIPNTGTPNNFIAPFWDDLSPQNGGGLVKYRYDSANNRFIVSYIDVPIYTFWGGSGSLNFQAILYPSGRIDLNYQTMDPGGESLNSATIGIEAAGGTDGLKVVYNAAYMHSSLSIRIDTGGWLSAEPTSGSVPSNDTSIATITFDATDLAEGTYTGNINLENNSPNNPHINIPVTLNVSVTPTPLIELNVSSMNDTVYSGYSTVFELLISNSGDANLTYNVTDNRTWISENPAGGDVPAALTDSIDITFNATSLTPGTYTGTVTVTSNDPNNATINVPVSLFVDLLLTDDVGVTEIISPPDSMATGVPYPIRLEVTNFGSETQTFNTVFEVRYDGSPTIIFADTLTVYNMPDNSINTYTFGEQFIPPIDEDYVFTAYTTLSSDQVPANNSSSKYGQSFDIVSVWYGNIDGSPVIAPIGENIYIDVTIQTPSSAYIADMHLCLGANDLYVDSLMSETENLFYYPLTEWAAAEFTAPQHTPPNPAGWTSQSFIGFARLSLLTDTPWLHSETPLHVMSFILKTQDNQNLIDEIIPAVGPGLNLYQGPSNAGDSLAETAYQLVEQFSELHFTPPAERIVNIWYGRVDGAPINAVVGANVFVDAYVQTSATGYIADLHLCLGADNQYIDTLISETESIFYYPLTEWMAAEFSPAQGVPPNPAGWSSQSFIGFSRLVLILDDAPFLHSTTPRRVMSFILKTVDNPDLIGQTQPAIGKGLNLYQGSSNAGDSTGDIGFYLIEHYSQLNFLDPSAGCDYVPGDMNGDGDVISSDVTYGVNFFRGAQPPPDSCYNESAMGWLYAAGDCNGDCAFIGSDITFLVNFFRGLQPEILWCPDTPPIMLLQNEDNPVKNSETITK